MRAPTDKSYSEDYINEKSIELAEAATSNLSRFHTIRAQQLISEGVAGLAVVLAHWNQPANECLNGCAHLDDGRNWSGLILDFLSEKIAEAQEADKPPLGIPF